MLIYYSLKYLSVAKIYGLTDYALTVLAREATCLHHLNVQGCWRITNSAIKLVCYKGR